MTPLWTWARGALGRALIALVLIGALVTGGWLLMRQPDPAQPAGAEPVPVGGAGVASGPSVLQASAPVQEQAQAPQQSGHQLDDWAANVGTALDIPPRALVGYATGELVARQEHPGCHLSWVTLAGLGKASSNHGRFGGVQIGPDGAMSKALGAVPLQGAAGESATEKRSGPLQLTSQQWTRNDQSIPGSAKPDVQDVDDAAVAAGRVLCAGGADLAAGTGWWKQVGAYRDSDLFRQQVLGNAQLYATLSLDPAKASAPPTRAARFALDQIGLPYVWGGNGPDAGAAGFDCSGLTRASYDSAGVSLPRTADSQFRSMPRVPPDAEPQLGDLVFYGSPNGFIHHVGLYLGNGLMINAPTEGQAIQIHTYHVPGDDYAGAGRPTGGK
jgi:cell wall-associated NlpC family hydrolase